MFFNSSHQLIYHASLELPILGISYKWNHILVTTFFHFAYCFQCLIKLLYVSVFHSFLWSKISICMETDVLFIHSSVNGCSGCFQTFAIFNNASVNTCVHVFMWIYVSISSGHTLRSRIAGSYVTLCLTLQGTVKLLFKTTAPFYIPTSNV